MESTDDARPRGLDALIPPQPTTVTIPVDTTGLECADGPVDVRIAFAPTTPRKLLVDVLGYFEIAAPPADADLSVALLVQGVTEPTGLLALIAETFGDQARVQIGLPGAFDGDNADAELPETEDADV